ARANRRRVRRRESMSRFISLSSTSSTFGIRQTFFFALLIKSCRRSGRGMRGGPPDRRADGGGNIVAEGIAFGDDLARLPHETLPFLRREFLGGEHDHRNVLPLRLFAEFVEELQTVHPRH